MSIARRIFELSDEHLLQDVGISKAPVFPATKHEKNPTKTETQVKP